MWGVFCMAKTVLITDDDPTQRRLLQAVIEREGYTVLHAQDGETCLDKVSTRGVRIDVILLDLIMPGLGGMATLKELSQRHPEVPVIVITATGGIETVVEAMRNGARDFFVKPASPERIMVSIANALKVGDLQTEVKRLQKSTTNALTFQDMIAGSASMLPVIRMGERAAKSNIPILITGESGVGKELVARAIQGASDRAGKPFISVNCGAIPENLVESILFGHEKGAFTGATDKHLGKFREAHGGTIFLDEVGELPLDMQVKLLRVLQESEVDPVGAKRPVKVDVRIVSATNRDLAEQVTSGKFREDLYYRLNVFPMEVPPLRQRREDIPALVEHFISRFNAQEGRQIKGARADTIDMLGRHEWPGNVRQLENAVFRAVILCETDVLTPLDFPQFASLASRAPDFDPVEEPSAPGGYQSPVHTLNRLTALPTGPIGDEPMPVEVLDDEGHLRSLDEIERDLIQYAIEVYAGHMSEVARRLGIGRSTLYRKVRAHDLEVEGIRD
jgi:DNA-binding NtrC family response regulator